MLVYGNPLLCRRKETWELITKVLDSFDFSVLAMGDFNQPFDHSDKISCSSRGILGADWAKDFVGKFGLIEVPGFAVHFTWTNNRKGRDATFERIDRAMADAKWIKLFPSAALFIYPIMRSDHSPLLIDTHWVVRNGVRKRPRRFEERWLNLEEVGQITRRVWEQPVVGSIAFKVVQKQKWLMKHLCNHNELSYRHLRRRLENTQGRIRRYSESIEKGGRRRLDGA